MIGENVLEGRPFEGLTIFDIHQHINQTSDFQMLHTSPEEVVHTMEVLGITGGCTSSILGIHSDTRLGNELMLEAVKRYPKKLCGYVIVSPHDTQVDLDRFFRESGRVKGLKVHAAFHRSSIDDARYEPFMEYANEHELPVLFHAWELIDTVHIKAWAKRYPKAKYIIGHGAFRTYNIQQEVISAIKGYENIFADTTVSVAYDGSVEWIVSRIGADRLCYGSDLPFYDCRHILGKLVLSHISDAEKEKILGLNALRILGVERND